MTKAPEFTIAKHIDKDRSITSTALPSVRQHLKQNTSRASCRAHLLQQESLAVRAASHRSASSSKETETNRVVSKDLAKLQLQLQRRSVLLAACGAVLTANKQASAFTTPPQGYRLLQDKLDGYSFLLPESWTPLSSSGNDIFYRNPYNVNENLFVNISSPSSSKYGSIEDLHSPSLAAERTKQQYVQELMSTRLGVRRTADVLEASERVAPDGKKYFDIELEAKSYASRNQLAVSQKQVDAAVELEWDRRYLTVLGVANNRLYEFRLQTATDTYDLAKDTLHYVAQSFRCTDVTS